MASSKQLKKSNAIDFQKEPMNLLEAEIAITALNATGEFSILRKLNLERESSFTLRSVVGSKIGICLDTETTGLNHAEDKIIELGIVAFEFDPITAEIIRITDRYNGFEDPGRPLPKEIIEITGITDDMVCGQHLDDDQVNRLANQATVVIAHNAGFDRKFVEARFPVFTTLPWACSVNQIDWQEERISTRVLEYLLFKFGLFINAHRALDDAEGVLGILLGKLPVSKTSVFKALLNTYDEVTSKICAIGAPFDKKDILKQRGYRWNDGSQGGSKDSEFWGQYPALFTGYLAGEQLQRGYASADLFVFPSATDTFGNVVLEAQASGLPVIVSDEGGPHELMIDGETGLVFRAGNTKGLATAIRFLTSDPEQLSRMGENSRRFTLN